MSPMKRGGRFQPLHMAGWLFADMLLVLALVAMGDQGDPQAADRRPAASAASSAAGKQSRHTGPRAVVRTPVKVAVDAPEGDDEGIVRALRGATARYQGRRAAFVLTFGRHTDPGAGGRYAHEVNALLEKARPDMFRAATTRDFWKGGAFPGHADIEIYFYTY
ncbi:hypothetical protein ACWGKW_31355 [Streptomyces sp. NPDC054766]|uniref:hypothetical protein n=1 Tax=Streptomyces rhizosphaerihabitans TaxID=1266770 RepID=UPI0021C07E94|nr:hypothetical protein [Streptomyces rhizosphaerihabitans]MCT9005649.1 hypothetical protein [Streptomyces rhizosphaerihabitans]